MKQHELFFEEAVKEAQKALCKRALCGSVVVKDGLVVGRGYNAPALDRQDSCYCDTRYGDAQEKPKSDRTCCVHAEWRAILDAVKNIGDIQGSVLYFSRSDENGNMLYSGEPYCTVCSRLALDTGVKLFGLWHESGITMYPTDRYNELSYNFHVKSNIKIFLKENNLYQVIFF